MEHTFEELSSKNVTQLREIAEGMDHEALHGYKTMRQEQLVKALCSAFGIEARAERKIVGINRGEIKARIKKLKVQREKALEEHNHKELKLVRRKIRGLKREIRKATVK
jgi:hypothetical protein